MATEHSHGHASVTFRRVQEQDLDAVVRLHHEALDLTGANLGRGGHWDDDLDAIDTVYLQSGGEFLVGILDDEIVAMGALRPLSDTDVELIRMRVTPQLQGHGIGRQLLRLLEAAATERGFTRIQLDTADRMDAAQHLYESAGYVERARQDMTGRFTTIYMDKDIADRPEHKPGPRVAVLASGAGTTFAYLVGASRNGSLDATIQLLIASRDDVPALAQADKLRIASVVLDANDVGADGADGVLLTLLRARSIDVVVLVGYVRKLGPRTLTAYTGRIINTHPAPLPRFGGKGMYGSHVHQAVLDSGVSASAATIHLVDAEYDTGPVIAEAPVPVLPDDTVDSLKARVQAAERTLLVRTIPSLRSDL